MLTCGATTKRGTKCDRPPIPASSDRHCIVHSSDAGLVAIRREAQSRGGRTCARRRQAEKARRQLERVDLGSHGAVGVFLGRASHLALQHRDAALMAAAAKTGEVALRALGVEQDRRRIVELEAAVVELQTALRAARGSR